MPMPPQLADDHDARFRLAMASAGIGMAIVSLEGRFVEVNPALCRMFGHDAEQLVGREVISLTHPDDVESSARLLARLRSGELESLDIEKRYLRVDGSAIDVLVNAAVMRDEGDERLYFIAQLRDVTGQRNAERQLRELNATLEQRVRERTAELEAANRRLEAFAYGVSHDLRAPLRAIDGFVLQLDRTAGDALGGQARDHLARIRGAVMRMGALIDSLLELARIGRAELKPSRVDVSLLAEWAAAELQDSEPGRAADVRVQPGLEAIGDERLLKAMLSQLLRNAWQFSSSRDRVEIEVEGQRTDQGLRIVVRDHGIGFDMAHAAKLFEPFQRLHGSEQGAGNGIGLAIAQQVAARHGGMIRGEGVPGEGARFHVALRDLALPGGAGQDNEAMEAGAA
jgi:PAS domain S-box-containing protein